MSVKKSWEFEVKETPEWKRVQKELKRAGDSVTKVGYPGNDKSELADIADIASINNFGTKDGKIPPRPFMDRAFDDNLRKIESRVLKEYMEVITGNQTVKTALARIGEFHVGQIKLKITNGSWESNAPSTIAAKGPKKNKPLIDTGEMRASTTHVEEIKG
jgi:hypothetical protein